MLAVGIVVLLWRWGMPEHGIAGSLWQWFTMDSGMLLCPEPFFGTCRMSHRVGGLFGIPRVFILVWVYRV